MGTVVLITVRQLLLAVTSKTAQVPVVASCREVNGFAISFTSLPQTGRSCRPQDGNPVPQTVALTPMRRPLYDRPCSVYQLRASVQGGTCTIVTTAV